MTDIRMHDESIVEHDAGDYLVAWLTALTLGATAGAAVWGLFLGAFFGLEYFGITRPSEGPIPLMITIAYNALPVLAGLFTLWRTYVKVLEMD